MGWKVAVRNRTVRYGRLVWCVQKPPDRTKCNSSTTVQWDRNVEVSKCR